LYVGTQLKFDHPCTDCADSANETYLSQSRFGHVSGDRL